MWRNTDVVAFVEWLRAHNEGLPPGAAGRVLRHGSLRASRVDARGARISCRKPIPTQQRARADRYACFDRYGEDPQAYAYVERSGSNRARTRSSRQLIEVHGAAPRSCPSDAAIRARRVLLRRAECPPGEERRGVLPDDVPRRDAVVEPARPAHGRHSRGAAGISTSPANPRSSPCGRTTRIWATRARRRWGSAAS